MCGNVTMHGNTENLNLIGHSMILDVYNSTCTKLPDSLSLGD